MPNLHERIAAFIAAYRLARGEPSATMAAVLRAFPRAERIDYVTGLLLANRLEREAAHG